MTVAELRKILENQPNDEALITICIEGCVQDIREVYFDGKTNELVIEVGIGS